MNLPPEQEAIRAKCFHPSGTFVEFAKNEIEQSIPERFEKIAHQYSEHIAVKRNSEAITYDALNRAANRLARRIMSQSDRSPEPVALFLRPGISLVIAELAVLKAGKINLFVNPAQPRERSEHILKNSEASIVVTDARHSSMIEEWANSPRTLIDVDQGDTQFSDDNLGIPISPSSYAELAYTSGSTGMAKGVLKSHRSRLRTCMDFINASHICAQDRIAVFGRGATGKHVHYTLLSGAAFYFVALRDEQLLHLANWLRDEKITIFVTLPTAFRHLATDLRINETLPDLRLIRMSGERLIKNDVLLFQKHFPAGCTLVNTYAAQETGDVCFYFIDRNSTMKTSRVPVGFPAEGTEIAVIDELGNNVGIDVPGEIIVQSQSLPVYCRNVAGRLNYTVAANEEMGDRTYHTGDIGQLTADGCLVHLGRSDSVVKIRTFRVDIGEVEAKLAEYPGVKETAVVSTESTVGDTRLVAYYVPHVGIKPTTSLLRRFLLDRLPEYMVPSSFVCLEKFPLTATGKVARRALPSPGNKRPDLDSQYLSPRTPIEATLENIWSDILGIEELGVNDSFFDLGGHSLTAMRVISRVIQDFQLEIPLQSLFQSPTIAEMAAVIADHQGKALDQQGLAALLDELESLSEEDAKKFAGDLKFEDSKH